MSISGEADAMKEQEPLVPTDSRWKSRSEPDRRRSGSRRPDHGRGQSLPTGCRRPPEASRHEPPSPGAGPIPLRSRRPLPGSVWRSGRVDPGRASHGVAAGVLPQRAIPRPSAIRPGSGRSGRVRPRPETGSTR
jgi:hypothetical protein